MEDQKLLILDYGSQYTQLIARRARELHIFSEILPCGTPASQLRKMKPLGIILSGGPASVYDKNAPQLDPAVFELEVPVLGICYGLQLITQALGGKVEPSPSREYGKATLQVTPSKSKLLAEEFGDSTIWMSHGDHVAGPPEGFKITGKSKGIICAVEDPELMIFGLQFHPEVAHSQYGMQILDNFLNLCGFDHSWTAGNIIEQQIEMIRQTVGDKNVVCALSGGVDSSIAATMVDRAIGKQQTCIFVDNGLLRQNEYQEVLAAYKKFGLRVKPVRAGGRFMSKLKSVTDPEQKRKIIGAEFIKIFEEEAKAIPNVTFLVQGTLYPDRITSGAIKGSAVIKSHHNVGGLPEKMKLKLIEPLRELFKDEVRVIGRELGLPDSIVERQPFPGPALGVRVVGEITAERVKILQQADAIVREEIEKHPDIRKQLYQYFAVLLPVKSVGVMGDGRTYENACVVKAFHSLDIMTADWARLPYDLLATISNRIVSEVRGINRVVYEITTKPPATIEWE